MRVLWVKAGKLLPVDTGGKIRSYNLLRHLAAWRDLVVLSYYGGRRDPATNATSGSDSPARKPCGPARLARARSTTRGMRCRRRPMPSPSSLAPRPPPDEPVAGRAPLRRGGLRLPLRVAEFSAASATPCVLFQHNVESVLWRRLAEHEPNALKRLVFSIEARKMARYERSAVARFDHVITVSERDRDAMCALTDPARVSVVPTGVNVHDYRAAAGTPATGPTVVFLGSMDWEPNIDAVEYFCRDVWPAVRAEVPGARFRIVGRNPHPRVLSLASSSVEVTGTVPAVLDHLREAAVVVVPLRAGGGTRLKIFEAMAAGRAVVSTSIGAEGLDVADGRDIVLADTGPRFAGAVIALLRDPIARARVGRAAADSAARHDWQSVAKRTGSDPGPGDRPRPPRVRRGPRRTSCRMRVLVLDGNENQAVASVRALARAGHRVAVGADSSWSKAGWSRSCAERFRYPDPDRDAELVRGVDCRAVGAGGRDARPAHDGAHHAAALVRAASESRRQADGSSCPRTRRSSGPSTRRGRPSWPEAWASRCRRPRRCRATPRPGNARGRFATRSCSSPGARWNRWPVARGPPAGPSTRGTPASSCADGATSVRGAGPRSRRNSSTGSAWAISPSWSTASFAPSSRTGASVTSGRPAPAAPCASASCRIAGCATRRSRARGARLARRRHGGIPRPRRRHAGLHGSQRPVLEFAGPGRLLGRRFPGARRPLAENRRSSRASAYRPGVRCRWLLGDLRHLAAVWYGAPAGYPAAFPGRLRTLADVLTPVRGTFHDNFAWRDPLPALGDWLHFVLHTLPRKARASQAGGIWHAPGRSAHP